MQRVSIAAISATRGDVDDDVFASAPVEILPKEIDLLGDADEKLPNTLVVTVIQARHLHTAALRSTLSCYVKLSSLGREFKTSVASKSDEPFWNETFSFRAVDWAASVTLSVRDKINVKMRFLGHVRISCTEIAALPGMATQSWFRLRDKNWERRAGVESEIELKIALVYTKKNDPSIHKDAAMVTGSGGGVDMEDEVVGVAADQDDETEEETFARRKELERLENERKNIMYASLHHGDYQIQVHVIEARDLKGENLSGTSDPFVQVEVMGHKKKTSTKYETLGCVYDEILFFHFKNIGRNELKQASIKLSVFDKEKLLKDNLIGSYQLDCLSVYFRAHHELYRQWVAVHDHLNQKDRGIQGFLLVSITVIGPGDTFVVHDREAEIAREIAAASAASTATTGSSSADGDTAKNLGSANLSATTLAALNPEGQSLVLLPPTIELKLHFLVVKVFKAEDLPPLDQGGLMVASGIDAFVQVGFGAHAACKSSVVTVKGNSNLAPEFLEELWIPVMAPTLCRHIAISVWDRDLGRTDELVGITSYDYHQVVSAASPGGLLATPPSSEEVELRRRQELELSETVDPPEPERDHVLLRWFNLYGPPLRRTNAKRAQWIAHNPAFGSMYRGRVLLSMERVEAPMPEQSEKFHCKRMKETALAMLDQRMPKTVKYVLRCALFCGTDLPLVASSLLTGSATRVRVCVGIGAHELVCETLPVDRHGRVNWEECKEKWPIVLPADLTQLPDIVVTLSRQIDKESYVEISFARLPASTLFQQQFKGDCQWIQLQEDIARRQTKYALDKTQSPGSLLLRLGFGREEVAVRTPWGADASLFGSFRHHRVRREFRVHVFQFRKLPLPETKLKLPNPFVSVHCCGQVQKTASKHKTLDPLFYETLVFVGEVPYDNTYSPDLVFVVHDASVSSSTSRSVASAILGELRLPMSIAQLSVANAEPARPTWYKLSARSGDTTGTQSGPSLYIEEPRGEALVSVQYIDHQDATATQAAVPVPPDNRALQPALMDANLEIVAIGVRQLKTHSVLGIRNPTVEFELMGAKFADGTTVWKSKPAISTSGKHGKNANLLERSVLHARLPVDTLFRPQLTIRVLETTLGGLRKTLLASSVVDLASKLPWSGEFEPKYEKDRAFVNPNQASGRKSHSGATQTNRRKSALDRLGLGKLRRASQQAKPTKEDVGEDAEDGEEQGLFSEDEYEAYRDPALDAEDAGVVIDMDDGMGLGDLPRTVSPALWSSSATSTQLQADPAVQDQLAREQQRRYMAGQADLLRGGAGKGPSHTGGVYGANGENAKSSVASYQHERDWWINQGGEELEHFLQGTALETYPLYRSVLTRPSLLSRKRVRVQMRAGIFKGVITVSEKWPVHKKRQTSATTTTTNVVDVARLKEPEALVVRVYVLRGCNLQAKDLSGYSDPYLRLKLGKDVQSDRANHKSKTLNPDFHKLFTFHTTLPGASQLEISVWDYDQIARDDLIGSTVIDLEDRWFHRAWQRLDGPTKSPLPDTALSVASPRKTDGLPIKPVENRHLYVPSRTTSQGLLQVWVDILTAQQAAMVPPTPIEQPAPQKFEVRVVVWRGENVTDKDDSEINDYFVKVWMEGGAAETTDVHWRCSSGKPCWNWRFKLPVEFPLRTPEFGRLHLQLWDKDVVKWNDVIGEAQLDLYKWIRRAYETKRSISPFLELKTLASTPPTPTVEVAVDQEKAKEDDGEREGQKEEEEDDEEDDDEDDEEEARTAVVARGNGTKESHSLLQRKSTKKPKMGKPKFLDKDKQKQAKDDKRKTKEAREAMEAKLALNGLLDFFGMGSLPEDAEWVTISYTDRESAKTMDMGRLGVSIQIVPAREAEMNPVGKGQEAPNVNPYLPPPVGRMRLTANPLSMLKQLVGRAMCLRIFALCCCVSCVMFIGVFGATIMSTLTFYEQMKQSSPSPAFVLPDDPYRFRPTSSTPVMSPAVTTTTTTTTTPTTTEDETHKD